MSDAATTDVVSGDQELPPIPFGETEPGLEVGALDEPPEIEEPIPPEDEVTDLPVEIVAGDTRVEHVSHEQIAHHRIGGTSAVRAFSVGNVKIKRTTAGNDDTQGVSIHRETLAEIHARLTMDPPDVAAALLLLPPAG